MGCRVLKLSCLLLLLTLINNALAQTFTAATSNTTTVCAGNQVTISYAASGAFGAGNDIIVELSDATGSFSSPVVLNTANTTAASGSYNVTIPAATPGGEFYKIRVVSSLPADTVIIGHLFTILDESKCNCQNDYVVDWQLTVGGRTAERFNDIIPTADGNFLLFGSSQSPEGTGNKTLPSFGAFDYWIVKVNPAGAILAEYNYGGSNSESGGCIIPTPDGGYLLGGFTESVPGSGNQTAVAYGRDDYWIIKIDANGIVQWDQSYGGNLDDELHAMVPTADGGYLLAGQSVSLPSGNKTSQRFGTSVDYWLVKTDANGNILWQDTYGGIFQDSLRDVIALPDGGFLLGGTSNSGVSGKKTKPSNSGSVDYYIVKIDANGNQIWDSVYGGSARDAFSKFVPTTDGGFLLVGISNSGVSAQKTSSNLGGNDIWVVKIDANGVQQWDSTYGGTGADGNARIVPARDGGFYVGGQSNSPVSGNKAIPGFGGNDFWLFKINENGIKGREYVFGGTENDALFAIQPTSDGGLLLGGQSSSDISGNKTTPRFEAPFADYWVIKLSPIIQLSATARTSTVCAGNALTIDYANTGCSNFNAGNNIRIELSNAAGSFASPTLLNTAATTANSGSYNVTIPAATPGGEFYRIRVISSNPVDTVVISPPLTIVELEKCNCFGALEVEWQVGLGGTNNDIFKAMIPTSDGGYLLGGFSSSGINGNKTSSNYGNTDYWVVKLDAAGNKLWDSSYGGSLGESLSLIYPTSDGGYILLGYSQSDGGTGNKAAQKYGLNHIWAVKINANGIIQWDQSYGGGVGSDSRPQAIVPTSDGGYLLGGYSNSGIGGTKTAPNYISSDYWVIKIDANGNQVWDNSYGGNSIDELNDMAATPDGGFLLAGRSSSAASGTKTRNSVLSDYWVVKIDDLGNQLWDSIYGGSSTDRGQKIIATPDGRFLLGGISSSPASEQKTAPLIGSFDIWVVKIDEDGLQLWDSTYGGVDPELSLNNIIQSKEGGFYLGCTSSSGISGNKTKASFGQEDYWIVRISADGSKQEEYAFGGDLFDDQVGLIASLEGGLVIGGTSTSDIGGNKTVGNFGIRDYWVIKVKLDAELSATTRSYTACAGEMVTVDYIIPCATLKPGNNIRIELSNAAGSFAAPTLLNNAATLATSGSYNITIPNTTPGGESYRIRVITTNPVDTVVIGKSLTIVSQSQCSCPDTLAITWQKVYGGTDLERFQYIVPTSDGGYLLGGHSNSGSDGNKTSLGKGLEDYWIVKTDTEGNIVWDSTYGGSSDDQLTSIIQTSDGGYLLGGQSNSPAGTGNKTATLYTASDYWVVKIDADGVKEWDQSYGGSGADILNAINATDDGGFLLGGHSDSPTDGTKTATRYGTSKDYWIVKIDANGNQIWDKVYGGNRTDEAFDISPSADGGFLIGGQSNSLSSNTKSSNNNSGTNNDFWVIKIDNDGNLIWDNVYGGTGVDAFRSIAPSTDGGFILAGYSNSPISAQKSAENKGLSDFWIVKIDESGIMLWDSTYGGSGNDNLTSTVSNKSGGLFLSGMSASGISGNKTIGTFGGFDYWVVEIDVKGIKINEYNFGSASTNETQRGLHATSEGGFLIGGNTSAGVSGNKTEPAIGNADYWLLKVGPIPEITPVTLSASAFCSGDSIEIEFDVTNCGPFNAANVFTYQLSDTLGSFTTPTILGTAPNTSTRDTTFALPPGLPSGTGYRIRILSSLPAVISDTNSAITINAVPDLSAGISVSCNNGLVISVPNQGTGATYQWQNNAVNIPSATNREYVPVNQGVYRVISSRGTCRDTAGTYSLIYATANGGKFITLPDGADRLICDSLTTHVMMRLDDNVDSKPHTNTSTNMYVVPSTPTYNGQPYVRRYWDVTPTAPKDKPATMTFYVTQADFNNFNDSAIGWPPLPTGPSDLIGIGNLVVSVFHGNSATNLPATYNGRAEYKLSGVSVTVNWNAGINLWEISLPVDSFSGFFVHTVPAVLPVTMVKFTGSFLEEVPGVLLNWETAAERDCDYFVVEKLMDNGQYKAIGSVPCFGNSNIPREYIFTDINFNNGSNIYRLKQVDYNGQFEYSKSIDVPVILPDRFNFKTWTDQVFIYTEVSEEGQINILDIQGRIVRSFPAIAGQRVQLFAANWPSGLYLVNFTNDNNQQTQKVILQR